MKKIITAFIVFFALAACSRGVSTPTADSHSEAASSAESSHHEMKAYVGSPELERMKTLAGDWKGVLIDTKGKRMPLDTSYRVISNGSAVMETIFKDTPMEMVTMYYDKEGKLNATHYCALANQPHLAVAKSTKNTMAFNFVGGDNINPKTDHYMSGMQLEFLKNGDIKFRGTSNEAGGKTECSEGIISRVSKN